MKEIQELADDIKERIELIKAGGYESNSEISSEDKARIQELVMMSIRLNSIILEDICVKLGKNDDPC